MSLLRSLLITLSTYTRLPLPKIDFKEEDLRYSFCFLPLAGALVGVLFCAWAKLTEYLRYNGLLRAAGFTLIPLWATGGIHMDGFLDTSDALASWQPREKKLEIMKDPHMGAFSVIRGGMYLLAMLALYSEVNTVSQAVAIGLGFVLSRCLVITMLILLPNARGSGMAQQFQQGQHKQAVLASGGLFSLISLGAGYLLVGKLIFSGAIPMAVTSLWFYSMSRRQFGGITGDLAGYLVQMSELAFTAGIVLLGGLIWS